MTSEVPSPNPSPPDSDPASSAEDDSARIYLLPNLMTAGNLFCGFVAMLRCVQALFASPGVETVFIETSARSPQQLYEQAVWFILAAVIFDMLDGRMARMTGKESRFGGEFDSLADVVSFGMTPALLVFFFLLNPSQQFPLMITLGGFVGFIYLLCAAVRLARFNVLALAAPAEEEAEEAIRKDFLGLPVPAAAGMVASLVLMLNRIDQEWRFLAFFLPALLVIVSLLMVSNIRYPSFKTIGARTKLGFRTFIAVFAVGACIYLFHFIAIAAAFLSYILYGLVMHLRAHRGFGFGARTPAKDTP